MFAARAGGARSPTQNRMSDTGRAIGRRADLTSPSPITRLLRVAVGRRGLPLLGPTRNRTTFYRHLLRSTWPEGFLGRVGSKSCPVGWGRKRPPVSRGGGGLFIPWWQTIFE